MLALKIALVAFLVGAVLFIVISGLRRWLRNRNLVDLSTPFEARYGSVMAGHWTPPIESNVEIVAEETLDPDDPRAP